MDDVCQDPLNPFDAASAHRARSGSFHDVLESHSSLVHCLFDLSERNVIADANRFVFIFHVHILPPTDFLIVSAAPGKIIPTAVWFLFPLLAIYGIIILLPSLLW